MLAKIVILCVVLVGVLAVEQSPGNGPWNRSWWNKQALAEKMYRGNLRALKAVLSVPQMPERYLTGNESFAATLKRGDKLLRFSWNNCGGANDPVKISNLNVQPDPVKIPGDIVINADVDVSVNISSPMPVEIEIKKKVAFFWVSVPCVDNLGSCDYQDFCPLLPTTCPPSFQRYHVPCNCPLEQGKYDLPNASVTIPELPLPSWLTTGDYKVTINAKDQNGNRLLCLGLQLSLD